MLFHAIGCAQAETRRGWRGARRMRVKHHPPSRTTARRTAPMRSWRHVARLLTHAPAQPHPARAGWLLAQSRGTSPRRSPCPATATFRPASARPVGEAAVLWPGDRERRVEAVCGCLLLASRTGEFGQGEVLYVLGDVGSARCQTGWSPPRGSAADARPPAAFIAVERIRIICDANPPRKYCSHGV